MLPSIAMARRIRSVTIVFKDDDTEFKVSYTHQGDLKNPGTKSREHDAKRMLLHAMDEGKKALERGKVSWGGHSEGLQNATDTILAE